MYGTSDKDEKSVNGTQISFGKFPLGTVKMGLPFQEFRLFRKISSETKEKVMFNLHLTQISGIFW